ncbi:MAG: hypothetical protein WBL87_05515 [Methanothrix sp.]
MKNVGAVFAAALVLLLAVSTASAQTGSGNVSEMAQKAEQTAKEAGEATGQVESAAKQLQNMTNATPGAENIGEAAKALQEKAQIAGEAATKAEEAAKEAAEAAEKLPSTPGFGLIAAAMGVLVLAYISLRNKN